MYDTQRSDRILSSELEFRQSPQSDQCINSQSQNIRINNFLDCNGKLFRNSVLLFVLFENLFLFLFCKGSILLSIVVSLSWGFVINIYDGFGDFSDVFFLCEERTWPWGSVINLFFRNDSTAFGFDSYFNCSFDLDVGFGFGLVLFNFILRFSFRLFALFAAFCFSFFYFLLWSHQAIFSDRLFFFNLFFFDLRLLNLNFFLIILKLL